MITPQMSHDEKTMSACLGDLYDFHPLFGQLMRFYNPDGRIINDKSEAMMKISEWFSSELEAGNAEFFTILGKLITITKKQMVGVSPLDTTLLNIQGWREGIYPDEDLVRAECGVSNYDWALRSFPVWPATIKELHSVVSIHIKCDEKTIRDAVKRLGIPVRAGKMGAPKRDKISRG